MLISHGHLDHLDLPSLARFPRETPLIVPEGLGLVVARKGFRNVTEVAVGNEVEIGSVTVRATPAEHGGGKKLPGRPVTPSGTWSRARPRCSSPATRICSTR